MVPAYDMNPTLNEYQSLLINSYTNKSDLNELLNSCEEYMLQKHIAQQIINKVLNAVKYWAVTGKPIRDNKNGTKHVLYNF